MNRIPETESKMKYKLWFLARYNREVMRNWLTILIVGGLVFQSCINREEPVDKSNIFESDYRLFQGTEAWEFAKAVEDQDISEIEELVSGGIDVDYREPKYGNTLLMLAVKNKDKKSVRKLLELGADPNKPNKYDGQAAIIDAAEITPSLIPDTEILELLLDHGADPSFVEPGPLSRGVYTRQTPLIVACRYTDNFTRTGIEKVKVLVENGADINYRNEFGRSALGMAMSFEYYNIALYLLEQGADYNQGLFFRPIKGQEVDIDIITGLREVAYSLSSKKHEQKMEIVRFLENKGLDYRGAPIPENIVRMAKNRYGERAEEYLSKY